MASARELQETSSSSASSYTTSSMSMSICHARPPSHSSSSPSSSARAAAVTGSTRCTTACGCGCEEEEAEEVEQRREAPGVPRRVDAAWGKWVSEIREPHKKSRIWLDMFPTTKMAVRAHHVAALAIKGAHATHLNFPELADILPRAASPAPKDVQATAALAAAFTTSPSTSTDQSEEDGIIQEEKNDAGETVQPESATTPTTSGSVDEAETELQLFDLPDLLLDIRDGFRFSPMWAPLPYVEEVNAELRLEEPLLWELPCFGSSRCLRRLDDQYT